MTSTIAEQRAAPALTPAGSEDLGPVAPRERIAALDLLRGWAMFGVLWSNLNDWYSPAAPATRLDRVLAWSQGWLIESRFYTLLCLLFGIGFGIQLARATERGVDLRGTYYRRCAALLAIGIVHGTLIWFGDILTMYALVAFALVLFRGVRTTRLLPIALGLWTLGPVIANRLMIAGGLVYWLPSGVYGPTASWIFGHGSWTQVSRVRVDAYLEWYRHWPLVLYWSVLAIFLAGLWAMKSGFLRRVTDDPRAARRLLLRMLAIAAVGYAAEIWGGRIWPAGPERFGLRWFVFRLLDWSTEAMGIAYAAAAVLLWQRGVARHALRGLSAAGRMALTTYLTQSVVCTLIFFGYGFQRLERTSYTEMFVLTITLFTAQMAFSSWWLARFRFGPVEWLWRTITYGRAPDMRVQTTNDTLAVAHP